MSPSRCVLLTITLCAPCWAWTGTHLMTPPSHTRHFTVPSSRAVRVKALRAQHTISSALPPMALWIGGSVVGGLEGHRETIYNSARNRLAFPRLRQRIMTQGRDCPQPVKSQSVSAVGKSELRHFAGICVIGVKCIASRCDGYKAWHNAFTIYCKWHNNRDIATIDNRDPASINPHTLIVCFSSLIQLFIAF